MPAALDDLLLANTAGLSQFEEYPVWEVFFLAAFATIRQRQFIVLDHDNFVGKPVAVQTIVGYHVGAGIDSHIGLGEHGFLYPNTEAANRAGHALWPTFGADQFGQFIATE